MNRLARCRRFLVVLGMFELGGWRSMTSVVLGGFGVRGEDLFCLGGGKKFCRGKGVQVLYACLRTWLLDMSLRVSILRNCTLQEASSFTY